MFRPILFLLALASVSFADSDKSSDPCAVIAGKSFMLPSDALACLKSFPFNETLRQNVLTDTISRVFDFYTFEDYYLDSPPPFQESTVNIRAALAAINTTKYATDYDFNVDLYNFVTRMNDGHTRWFPDCYTNFQNLLPAPIVSLEVDGIQSVYIIPDLVELIPLLGTNYTDLIKICWNSAGAKVISIEGQEPYTYVDFIAKTVSGNYLDHGRFGDLAGPTGVAQDSLTFELIAANSTKIETVTVPYIANFFGTNFTDRESYWANNCLANADTNGVDFKLSTELTFDTLPRKQPMGNIIDKSTSNGVGLPTQFEPTFPTVGGDQGVIKSYVLPGKKTGVMFVGSFDDDFTQFQNDTVSAITAFQKAGVTRLIIDLSNNGGGFICLGQFLHQYLAGARIGYPGFQSSVRANPLARKIVASDIELGLNDSFSFYTADNYAFFNGTQMSAADDYMTPDVTVVINGRTDVNSQRFHDTCNLTYVVPIPNNPPFDLQNVAIVSNGNCASTCAMFSTLMNEREHVKIAVWGGKPFENVEFKGMAGNQVLEWFDIDSEIKTANLKDDPLAPADLLVSGDFRHNWRTAWSYFDENEPIAYVSELPRFRFPYTLETYNNPPKFVALCGGNAFCISVL
ncbi:TSPc domain-containing protein [Mycena sanguinolenta]|uniref:TSPc domain-containing protein n=1 Tax=Mycena sanguinolenta TaxID=230812 RepID=A0A8H6YXU8_9AGAR|nr:TSPc domain-containing protein [Mycena sanguinolenta]